MNDRVQSLALQHVHPLLKHLVGLIQIAGSGLVPDDADADGVGGNGGGQPHQDQDGDVENPPATPPAGGRGPGAGAVRVHGYILPARRVGHGFRAAERGYR